MNGAYQRPYSELTTEPVIGSRQITRQELTTYEWRNNTLFKIVTIRQFSYGGSDYDDTQTVTPVYHE